MKRTRYILAVALVTTALCADRLVISAPAQARPQMAQLAGRLVARLSVSFRHIVPAARMYADRQHIVAAVVQSEAAPPMVMPPHRAVTFAEYPLPPPAC